MYVFIFIQNKFVRCVWRVLLKETKDAQRNKFNLLSMSGFQFEEAMNIRKHLYRITFIDEICAKLKIFSKHLFFKKLYFKIIKFYKTSLPCPLPSTLLLYLLLIRIEN